MDIDAISRQATELMKLKPQIEEFLAAAGELARFKSNFDAVVPEIRNMINDAKAVAFEVDTLVGDIAKIRADLGPALAWIEQKQAAEAEAEKAVAAKAEESEMAKARAAKGTDSAPPAEAAKEPTSGPTEPREPGA